MTFDVIAAGTRMTAVTSFTSVEQMELMLGMGMKTVWPRRSVRLMAFFHP